MGARGPIPKDSSLKVLSGKLPVTKENLNGGNDAHVIEFEPPEPPSSLTPDQAEVWNKTIEMLKPLRYLEKIDVAVLGAYCCSYCMWRDAQRTLDDMREGNVKYYMIATGATGALVAHPLIQIIRQAQQDMVAYAKEMGMTPSVRMRMTTPEPPPSANPFAKLKSKTNERMGKKS